MLCAQSSLAARTRPCMHTLAIPTIIHIRLRLAIPHRRQALRDIVDVTGWWCISESLHQAGHCVVNDGLFLKCFRQFTTANEYTTTEIRSRKWTVEIRRYKMGEVVELVGLRDTLRRAIQPVPLPCGMCVARAYYCS
jgi:hypothetical protein